MINKVTIRSLFLATILGMLLLAACGTRHVATTPLALAGTHWQLTAYQAGDKRQSAHADRAGTLGFTADAFSGSTGCNSYGGTYTLEQNHLLATGVFSTKMACADPANEQERVFLAVLNAKPSLEQTSGGLTITSDKGTLYFEAAPAADKSQTQVEAPSEPQERPASAAPAWRVEAVEPSVTGMFAYMADAAVFISCTDKKRYPVAMEAGFLKLERDYLALLGDEAGQQVFLCAKAKIVSREQMDGVSKAPTLLVEEMYSISRQAKCATQLERMAGEYYTQGKTAKFVHCLSGQEYSIAAEAAATQTRQAYEALNTAAGTRVYVEIEGHVAETGPLHLSRLLGFRAGETCRM